ncbi:peptidoglycan editing factor PgeF [Aerophototrophica crusticola]|uniref:Purine nucleoside phosphorylase n=1 Tax=Aerophototrophica crusticola TaxID=1709002 RepID=A0A858R8U8_9PROT|nr:peptidoglycan editing factor PgeF [Rhodospirillaceae bacterium B3]
MITLGALNDIPAIRHGFFTREGGVSSGLYDSLNCGFGSGDTPEAVAENRARAMRFLDLQPEGLVTVYQVHSPTVVTVDKPFAPKDAPKADAMVTRLPRVALGILTADCAPVLFCDPQAEVIGAAHAGWKGAMGGVVEATVSAMEALGAKADRIVAAVGPHIAHRSYEVGAEFRDRFLAEAPANDYHFVPARRAGHYLFDLGGYVEQRLANAGVQFVHHSPHDTLAESDRFFSYRRATLNGEKDYGRGLSAIALAE